MKKLSLKSFEKTLLVSGLVGLVALGGLSAWRITSTANAMQSFSSQSNGVGQVQIVEKGLFSSKIVSSVSLIGAGDVGVKLVFTGVAQHGLWYLLTGEIDGNFDVFLATNGIREQTAFSTAKLSIKNGANAHIEGVFDPKYWTEKGYTLTGGKYSVDLKDGLTKGNYQLLIDSLVSTANPDKSSAKNIKFDVVFDRLAPETGNVSFSAKDIKAGPLSMSDISVDSFTQEQDKKYQKVVFNAAMNNTAIEGSTVKDGQFLFKANVSNLQKIPFAALAQLFQLKEQLGDEEFYPRVRARVQELVAGGIVVEVESFKLSANADKDLAQLAIKIPFPVVTDITDPTWSQKIQATAKLELKGRALEKMAAAMPESFANANSPVIWDMSFSSKGLVINGAPATVAQMRDLSKVSAVLQGFVAGAVAEISAE